LEDRVVLSGAAPFILHSQVQPADGSTTTDPHPVVSVTYSESMNATQAGNTANYLLFSSSGGSIPIQLASYNDTQHTTTLTYFTPLGSLPADQYSLFVRGDQIHDAVSNLPLAQPDQLIVANPGTQNVSVINAPGDGTLQAVTNYAATFPQGITNLPTAVAFADVNGDGVPDLVLLSRGSDTVEVFNGLGGGLFATTPSAALALPTGAGAQSLVVTDLNADGMPDIAVADTALNEVSVFINFQHGIFQPRADYTVGRSPISIVAADFDNDSHVDLAVVSNVPDFITQTYNVSILRQNPADVGKFLAPLLFDTGVTIPTGLAAGDVAQSGLPDLVVSGGSGVKRLVNTSTPGTFHFSPSAALTTTATAGVAIGLINSDTIPDIVAITRSSGGQILVFQGLGSGFFTSPIPFNLNALPTSVALGDLNGDAKDEVFVTTGTGTQSAVAVFVNQSTFTTVEFAAPVSYSVDNTPVSVAVDINSSSNLVDEVAVANSAGSGVTVLKPGGNATLQVSTELGVLSAVPSAVAVADLNNDHLQDLVIASVPTGFSFIDSVTILLNQGDGTFAALIPINVGSAFSGSSELPLALAIADLTGDGLPDIIVTNPGDETITILANEGAGAFVPEPAIRLNQVPTGIVAGDFNNDGKIDLAISHTGTTTATQGVTILLGNGDRTFAAPTEVVTDISPIAIVAADFHQSNTNLQNPQLDLAVIDGAAAGMVQVLQGSGAGSFTKLAPQSAGANPTALAVGDINGDGFPDLIVATHTSSSGTFTDSVTVLLNDGVPGPSNQFGAPIRTDVFSGASVPIQALTLTNLNNDPFPDVAAVSQGSVNNVFTLLGNGDGTFQTTVGQYSTAGGGLGTGSTAGTVTGDILAASSNTFIRATTFTVATTLISSNLITNGNFGTPDLNQESGNLVGWQTAAQPNSHGQWSVQTGTVSPYGSLVTLPGSGSFPTFSSLISQPVPPPVRGQYAAMLDEPDLGNDLASSLTFGAFPGTNPADYSGTHVLYQDFQVPDAAIQVTLTMALFIRSNAPFTDTSVTPTLDFSPNPPANQQVRVDIMDPLANLYDVGAGVLRSIFITRQTDPRDTGGYINLPAVDLSALHGRTVRLRIASANNQGKLIVGVDNVQVQAAYTATTAPSLNGIHLRNPGFGATTTFGGNTNDPTIDGNVSDIGSPANIVRIEIDPNNDGFGGPDDFALTRRGGGIDAFGHFTTTLPAVLPNGEQILPGLITVGIKAINRAGLAAATTFTFNLAGPSLAGWLPRGPNQVVFNANGVAFSRHGDSVISGRIIAVAADPHDATGNTYVVGSDNGGLWKTIDGGTDWTPLTDFVLDAQGNPVAESISSIAFDPRVGSQTIYAATGVADNLPTSHAGVGVLRSLDGGLTWTVQGRSSSIFGGARISKLLVTSQGFIYVAVASGGGGPGVYRSMDMGQTWTNVLTPATTGSTTIASVTDIAIDPLDEQLIWAGLGNINLLPASDSGGVWFANNATSPQVQWVKRSGGDNENSTFFDVRNQSIPANFLGTNVGKVLLAVPSVPTPGEQIVYVMMTTPSTGFPADGQSFNEKGTGNGASSSITIGLYKTRDAGRSYTPIMLRENVPLASQPFHFANLFTMGHEASDVGALVVDPSNPNVFYIGGSNRYIVDADFLQPQPFFVPDHALLRVDTTYMRDTSYVSPFIPPPQGKVGVIPNDGDDIFKATDAALNSMDREPGSYPTSAGGGGSAYMGEGVFWYDLATGDFGGRFPTPGIDLAALQPHSLLPQTIHALAFDARGRLLVGTELGIWRGVAQGFNYDRTSAGSGIEAREGGLTPIELGMTFSDLNTNLQITNVTSVAIDPYQRNVLDITQPSEGWARSTGGLQYVSTTGHDPITGTDDAVGEDFPGPVRTGPAHTDVAPGTPSTVYRSRNPFIITILVQSNEIQKSIDGGLTFDVSSSGLATNQLVGTFYPLAVNPVPKLDSNGVQQDQLAFWINNRIFITDNSGGEWNTLTPVLPSTAGRVTSIAFGPNSPDGQEVLYFGTVSGHVFVTFERGGDGFLDHSSGLPQAIINGVQVDPFDRMTAYAMIDGTGHGHVFRTTNGGLSWTDISQIGGGSGLPDVPAYVMAIDRRSATDPGKLFVGNGVGVYVLDLTATNPTWQRLGVLPNPSDPTHPIFTLPNVPVVDLQFNANFEELVAATEGRGVFQINTDRVGPRVSSVTPSTPVAPGLGTITVTFNKPVDPRTFTTADVVSLHGPLGEIPVNSVVDLDPTLHLRYELFFQPQTQDGIYTLVLSRHIRDFVGFELNQNTVTGQPSSEFTANFAINITDNGRFISGIYNDILHRATDTPAFLSLLPTLDADRLSAQAPIAQAIVTSPEARTNLIVSAYQTVLGRIPQPAEIANWLGALGAGTSTPEQILAVLLASNEFFLRRTAGTDASFANQAYLDVLGRPVDSTGLASFLSVAEVAPRTAVMRGVVLSTEYMVNLVEGFYSRFVPTHGTPTTAEILAWLSALQNGLTDEQAISAFIGSPEYFANHGADNSLWLSAAYNAILGRPIDSQAQGFLNQLQQGTDRSTVALELLTSAEYRGDLLFKSTLANPTPFYTTYLGRSPTIDEINSWLAAFGAGARDESIITVVLSSAEYFQRVGTGSTQAAQDQSWLTSVYSQILGRPVDPGTQMADLGFMASQEQNARNAISQILPNTDEFRVGLVTRTYVSLLNRRPAGLELASWVAFLGQPSPGPGQISLHEQFVSAVLESPEYFNEQRQPDLLATSGQWVTSLFTVFLGRVTSAAETQPFVDRLLSAYQSQRLADAKILLGSVEHRIDLVKSLFGTYLRRAPRPIELAVYLPGGSKAGFTDEQIIATLLASDEYFQNPNLGNAMNSTWLNQVYRDLLGRDRDAGSQPFLDLLNNAGPNDPAAMAARLQVATAILGSNEFQVRLVTQLFTTFLGRGPSTTEVTNFTGMLQQGSKDEDLIGVLVSANEYFQRSHPFP
jgi:hypothetical protein